MTQQPQHQPPERRPLTEEEIEQKKKDLKLDKMISDRYGIREDKVREKLDPIIVKYIQDFFNPIGEPNVGPGE